MRILVVDDQRDLLACMGDMLAHTGHDVILEPDSITALARVDRDEYDILVTDLKMPGVGGVEIIRHVRRKKPNLWIVAMSGGGDTIPVSTMLHISEAFGADRVLYKPFRKPELLAAIEKD